MTAKPSKHLDLINVGGTELVAGDTRERYRQKIARITLDSMVQFVGLLDANGTVLEINQVALDAVGIALADVEGRPFWTTFWWQVSEEINATLRESIRRAAQGEFVRWDTEIYGRAGGKETIIIDASLMPVKDAQGKVVFIAAEGRDITEKKAYEREIARQREELAQLDKLKTQFFANISHEFRTPLTLMMGPLEDAMAQPEELSAQQRQRLGLAHRNSLRLLKLVNTLLDFSRIEAGRIQASYERTDLASLTRELASVFHSAIERAGMRLLIDCPAFPAEVYVDREMWEKIVLNLLSNAFKFTFEGEIEVSLRVAGARVELAVRDTGTGIPADEVPRLFERFHRVKGAQGRSYEGSGIGLALVQELARLHGGSVGVESEAGRGSRFIVSLPLGKEHLPADRIQAARELASTGIAAEAYVDEAERWWAKGPEIPGARHGSPARTQVDLSEVPAAKELVLVADDNADMRDYLSNLLREEYRVHLARNGEEAIQATRELRPSLVLTDVMMPGLDGFGVLQAIRNDPSLSTTPVILLSARAGEESRVEGLQAGADDYLVKPFTARELMARVATHVKMAHLRSEAAIRERRLREEAEIERQKLQQSEEHLRAIVETTPECVKVVASDGTLLHMNSAGLAMVEAESLAAIEGKSVYALIAPEDHDLFHRFNEKICSGEKGRLEFSMVGLNGVRRRMETHAVPLPTRDGSLVQLAVTRDISARNEAEEAQRRLAAIVESSDDAIASKDLNGIVTSWNKSAERLFGYKAEEIIGRPVTLIIPPELHQDERMILGKIRRGERIEHFETVRVAKNGDRIAVSLTISPVKDGSGNVVGAAKIVRDITEQKKVEHALRTTEKLAAAGRLAATVAHEINNPLEAVTNLVYLARRDLGNANKVGGYLELASRELERVAHIARQTLGFYRDTSSPLTFNVGRSLDDLLLLYSGRFAARNIRVEQRYDKDLEIIAMAGEIRQAFSNLITNAIDAMPAGGVLVVKASKSHDRRDSGAPGVRITVVDTGSGIAPKDRKHLFQPFFTTKTDVGTGLGLWITRSIVEKHGGTIRFRTRTGTIAPGTAFSIFLPIAGKASTPAPGSGRDATDSSAILTGAANP